MIRSICLVTGQFCMRHIKSWPWPTLLTGLGCGLMLLSLLQQFFAQLGNSRPVTAACCTVIGMAWAIAWGSRQPETSSIRPSLASALGLTGMLAVWTVANPTLWQLHDLICNEGWLASRWAILLYSTGWAAATLGLPVWCIARLSLFQSTHRTEGNATTRPSAACVLGIALGIGLSLVITWSSLYITALLGCAVLIGARVWMYRKAQSSAEIAALPLAQPAESNSTTWSWESLFVALACGGLCFWATHVLKLVFPSTIFTLAAIASGTLFGIACGCQLSRRVTAALPGASLFLRCCMVANLLVLCAGFSEVVYRLLNVTGSVSQVWLMQLLRWGIIGCYTSTLGIVWALATARLTGLQTHLNGRWQPQTWGFGIILALVGGTLSNVVLIPVCGLNLTCYIWLWTIAGVQAVELVRHRVLPRNTLVRGIALGCAGALVATPAISSGVRPELAGRLLFATNVFQAAQIGIPDRQLAFLDDARLEGLTLGEHGALTIWRSAVARHQIRENGIPRGTISTNTQISPNDTAEVALALLPLTLHEGPSRIALLGIGAGTPLQTALGCPIQQVTAVETDPGLVALLKQTTTDTEAAAMWQDDRVTMQVVDPALWVAASREAFDVVISNPDPSLLMQGSSQYTREFYGRAARRLSADGIFCQRFQYFDYGPQPIQTIATTLRSVFTHVLAVETGPGEMAWLATNSEAGLIRPEVVDRMQAAHVRALMAEVGWDWSVLLTLAAYDTECLDKVVAGKSAINSATNGRLCVDLPGELMRWAPKAQEIQASVTTHASKILNWVGEAGADEDLLRRLAEVRGQQELIANYPDQYWGYRSQVRKQVASRPLTPIQQIKYEAQSKGEEVGGLHPDDKRRLRYFQQLSKAKETHALTDLDKLAEYAAPYDPLISLFLHQELAEIAAAAPELPPSIELTHRLHMLHFAPSFDQSIRNGLAGLRLVLEKPECVASKAERWDVINGFLHILQIRWENRAPTASGNPRLAVRDVEENIVLAERALEELPKLATEVAFTTEDWGARKRNIERRLLAPLRDYRERLLPLAAKQRMEAAETEPEMDAALDLPSLDLLQFPGSGSPE